MTTEHHVNVGRGTALISFLLGIGIFGLYFLTSSFELLFVGYGFIVLAGLVNLAVLLALLIHAVRHRESRKKTLRISGLMLLNIPVMLACCWGAMLLLNIMRITFTNETGTTLTDMNIIGCDHEHIDRMGPDEIRTVWVDIAGDCSIDIDYLRNNERVKEEVLGYVTNDMGAKMHYAIGGKHNEAIP